MTTQLETVCAHIEGLNGEIESGDITRFVFEAGRLAQAVREIRALQQANLKLTAQRDRAIDGCTKHGLSYEYAKGRNVALQEKVDELTALLNLPTVRETQLEAEVQSLRGAFEFIKAFRHADLAALREANAVIERLRAVPSIRASGAMVAIDANGAVSIQADHVEITGTVAAFTGDIHA
jgi:hypothetical protein